MIAFVDESVALTGDGLLYVVVGVGAGDLDRARTQVRGAKRPHQPHLHWRADRRPEVRRELLALVSDLDLTAFAVARRVAAARDQEKARSQCLGRLAQDLWAEGVAELVVESRGVELDDRDASALEPVRGPGGRLRWGHAPKSSDPMLWVADIVAGVVAAHLSCSPEGPRWWAQLRPTRLSVRQLSDADPMLVSA